MGRYRNLLAVLVFASVSMVNAGELSDRAAELGLHEWVKINGDSPSLNAIIDAHWTDDEHCEWTDSAGWDPVSKTLVTIVQDVAERPHEELTYREATNRWSWRNFDTVIGQSNTVGHNYDELCSNPNGNEFFETRWSQDQWFGTWNPSTDVVDWVEITSTSPNKEGGAQACVFAPWLDSGNGGVAVQTAGGNGHLYWTSLSDLRTRPGSVRWGEVNWSASGNDGDIHKIMTAHLAEEYIIFVGGGADPDSNRHRDCRIWEKGSTSVQNCANAPIGVTVYKQKLIYDPASQQVILWGGDDSNKFWSYDRSTDRWSEIVGQTAPSALVSGGNRSSTCVSQVAIPEYGVVAFVRMNNREWCNSNPTQCGIWLTKFGEADPPGPDCSDGIDNDSDGATDFPADQGCSSADDDTERGANECDDGIDNDGDGSVDTVDAGCTSAAGVDESNCGDGQCEGGETTVTCSSDCSTLGAQVINPGAVVWDRATPYSIGYKIPLEELGGADSDSDGDSSVSVRYRLQGGGAWRDAYPPLLVFDEVSRNEPHNEGRNYSGAIWNLQPNTDYEIEFTIFDPDGFDEVRTEISSTRAEPAADPANPNYPCPDGDTADLTDNGTSDECDTLAEVRTAVAAAVAGSVIKVSAGTYGPGGSGDDGLITFSSKTGTPENPIILRCMDRVNTVIDGGQLDAAIQITNSSHVVVEDCTLTGGADLGGEGEGAGSVVLSPDDSGTNIGVTIRRNIIDYRSGSASVGIYMKNGDHWDFNYLDNAILGPEDFPDRATSNTEGIVFQGNGGVIAHNYINGAGDSISHGRHQPETNPHAAFPTRHVNVFGNHADYSKDDCMEADYTHANMIFHHNKCENWNACISVQPSFGGPSYWFRNICWSGGPGTDGGKTVKLQAANTTYGDPAGVHLFNNLLTMPIVRYSDGVWDYVELNNLFVGADDGSQISNTSVNVCGSYGVEVRQQGAGFDDPTGDAADCDYHGTLDYAAFSYNGRVDYPPCGSFDSVTAFRFGSQVHPETGERCYANSFVASDPIFASINADDYPDLDTDPNNWYSISDPRLHAISNVIDAGVVIPNVTDTYSGTAPDIGPLEYGTSVFPYGTRGWVFGGPADETPPSVPGGLAASPTSESTVDLTWSESEDPESGVSQYIAYRAGVEVGRSTSNSFTDSGLSEASSYSYRVRAVNGAGLESGLSDPVSTTTLADTTPPSVTSVSAVGDPARVTVVYSEPVEQASATAISNYEIDNGVAVLAAVLGPDTGTVSLTTSPHVDGVAYNMTINNVRDRAANANTIAPDSRVSYQFSASLVITNLDVVSGRAYEVREGLQVGSECYVDRSFTYEAVPALVLGSTYIATANDDKYSDGDSDFLSFDVNQSVTVYVAHDDRYSSKPSWLGDFQDSGSDVTISGENHSLFQRSYSSGTVTLGGNVDAGVTVNHSMYTVIIVGQPAVGPPGPPGGLRVD